MRFLASPRWRIFLIAWMLYSVHFATNVVREHYPAFSISQHGSFYVDEYQGFHSDIFVGPTGHSVIGNQVFVSVLAAVPLFVFRPLLDEIERYSLEKKAKDGVPAADYRIDKPNRVQFFRIVKERGLDLRFGAATFITTAFFMAPATALFLVYFYGVLRRRSVDAANAAGLTFLLGFGTPLFYRTSTISHNLFVMYAMFAAFVLLWPTAGQPVSTGRRLSAGLLAGVAIATDYVGVIVLPLLFGYWLWARSRDASWRVAMRETWPIAAGVIPAALFLLYSQWVMYGNPFYPGQHWMPNQNVYVKEGMRGFTWPDPELFLMSLIDPSFGMYSWAPILLLALVPAWWYAARTLVLPRRERAFVVVAWVVFLLFTSANQYSRLQFNSGFRYLVPLVPFLMLALADHWIRLDWRLKTALAAVAVAHSWVLTVYREPVLASWKMLWAEGPQLPWYRVLSLTSGAENPYLGTWWVPTLILAATLALAAGIWRYGTRLEMTDVH